MQEARGRPGHVVQVCPCRGCPEALVVVKLAAAERAAGRLHQVQPPGARGQAVPRDAREERRRLEHHHRRVRPQRQAARGGRVRRRNEGGRGGAQLDHQFTTLSIKNLVTTTARGKTVFSCPI